MIFWESRSFGARMAESFSFAHYWYSLVSFFSARFLRFCVLAMEMDD